MHPACFTVCGLVTWERQGRFVRHKRAARGVGKLLDQAQLAEIGPLGRCPPYRLPAADRWRPEGNGEAVLKDTFELTVARLDTADEAQQIEAVLGRLPGVQKAVPPSAPGA